MIDEWIWISSATKEIGDVCTQANLKDPVNEVFDQPQLVTKRCKTQKIGQHTREGLFTITGGWSQGNVGLCCPKAHREKGARG